MYIDFFLLGHSQFCVRLMHYLLYTVQIFYLSEHTFVNFIIALCTPSTNTCRNSSVLESVIASARMGLPMNCRCDLGPDLVFKILHGHHM